VERGTRLHVSVLDSTGRLSVRSEEIDYQGRLVDSVDLLQHDRHVRIQIGLDVGIDQSVSFNPVMTLMGRVAPLDYDSPGESSFRLGPGAEFAVYVLRLSRGLLWSAVSTEPEGHPAGAQEADHSKSGVEVRVVEHTGQLQLSGANQVFDGWLIRVPLEFIVGQQLHVRVVVPTKARDPENMDVLGRVVQILAGEVQTGRAPFAPGVRFGFGIVQHSSGELPLPVVGKRWVDEFLVDSARVPAEVFMPPESFPGSQVEITDPSAAGSDGADGSPPRGEPTGMIGSLRQLSLISLLQSLELNRRTARIEVTAPPPEEGGDVYIHNGKVVAAFAPGIKGEEAFYSLALLDCGAFRVHFGQEIPRRNIIEETTDLILEVLNRSEDAEAALLEQEASVVSEISVARVALGSEPGDDTLVGVSLADTDGDSGPKPVPIPITDPAAQLEPAAPETGASVDPLEAISTDEHAANIAPRDGLGLIAPNPASAHPLAPDELTDPADPLTVPEHVAQQTELLEPAVSAEELAASAAETLDASGMEASEIETAAPTEHDEDHLPTALLEPKGVPAGLRPAAAAVAGPDEEMTEDRAPAAGAFDLHAVETVTAEDEGDHDTFIGPRPGAATDTADDMNAVFTDDDSARPVNPDENERGDTLVGPVPAADGKAPSKPAEDIPSKVESAASVFSRFFEETDGDK